MTYQELIGKCRKGEATAQKQLYDRLAPVMFALCLRYCGNTEDAQDAMQDGFIRMFQYLDKYNELGSFEGWVRRIMVNSSLTTLKKAKKRRTQPEVHMERLSYKTNIISDMSADELMGLVQRLPSGYRTVFNMYVIEGYSHKEIGELLGIQESTSRSQLLKSRKMMRTLINNNELTPIDE